MDGTLGEIRMFAPDFAPKNWVYCNGQTLPINQYAALFSILGTAYGGNGTTNFLLPDLKSRAAIGVGQGTDLSNYALGQKAGSETTVLAINNIPSHNHTISGTITMPTSTLTADVEKPAGNYFAKDGSAKFSLKNSNITMKPANLNNLSLANTGTGQGVNNIMPSVGINYIICTAGIYPSRG